MKYRQIVQAEFIDRPNRFIAHVNLDGKTETVHVKNTGRCKELLLPGATVYLEKSDNPARSTAYDLVAVMKGDRLVNMDSQAPNKVVEEWLNAGGLFEAPFLVRPETKYGNSRFDFYVETETEKIFIEVKGVTREENQIVCFPDAPSERAIKHVGELVEAKKEGYRVFVLFVIQMENVRYFTPDVERHAAFADALRNAAAHGVEVLAYECQVTPDSLTMDRQVPVSLTGEDPGNMERPHDLKCAKTESMERSHDLKTVKTESLESLNETLSAGLLSEIPKPLIKWYDSSKRVLPWRQEPTPYRVWVSEIMLQQTRVEAVKPYYERFMNTLPDIKSLAQAEEETLLKLWEGLGYYNRVRNLQKAAIQIEEEYGGSMPADYEQILTLKGIGSYTAGAIASIAFGLPYPAVDGNVLRVLSRIRADERNITDAKVKTQVEQELAAVMPKDRPGDFNQAMMELGACVCVPNGSPHCEECPLAEVCLAHKQGRECEFPKKDKAKARSIEEKTVLVIRDENKAALRKRPSKGLLAGMYEFPCLEGYHTAEEVVRFLDENGLKTLRITTLKDAKHIFTHKEWHMRGYMVRVDELEANHKGVFADWIYVEPAMTESAYPIPSAYEAYTDYLKIRLGSKKWKEV